MSIIRPYRVIDSSHLQLGVWTDASRNTIVDSARFQVGVDLKIQCHVTLDIQAVVQSLFDGEFDGTLADTFDWVVEWYSSKTKLGGLALRTPVSEEPKELSITLPGDQIGDRVEIYRRIVLNSNLVSDFTLAPKQLGSIVWSDTFEFRIEGVGGQMPITFVAFDENGLNRNAIWTIDFTRSDSLTDESFDEPFPEHMRILLNFDNPIAKQLARAESLDDPALGFTLKTLARDALTSIIELAAAEFFDVSRKYEIGSLGQQIAISLKLVGISDISEFRSRPYMTQMAMIQGAIYR